MKEYIISNEKVSKEDDVQITIRESIPQPDIVKEKTISIKSIKLAIENCDAVIQRAQLEKAEWQKILGDGANDIESAVVKPVVIK